MDEPSPLPVISAETRQKRVQPSRSKSKRVATGVGSSDVDIMILETQKRKHESEPLIPVATKFFLTTNSAIASSSSSDSSQFNIVANERYFSRPEVLESFRRQATIETPSFVSLGGAHTNGRFRARSQSGTTREEDDPEVADAIYLKRHRKFEHFEKRGRLREKEKLQHEHYKLKERIEQLEKLDGAAFMSISADYFPDLPQELDERLPDHELLDPNAALYHGTLNAEGERRRKEMLATAHLLEERYRRLLPPRRKPDASTVSLVLATPELTQPNEAEELPFDYTQKNGDKPRAKTKAKAPQTTSAPLSRPESARKAQKGPLSPIRQVPSSKDEEEEPPAGDMALEPDQESAAQMEVEPTEVVQAAPPKKGPKLSAKSTRQAKQGKVPRSASVGYQETTTSTTEVEQARPTPARDVDGSVQESVEEPTIIVSRKSAGRPRKRPRLSPGASASPVPSHPTEKEMSAPPPLSALRHLSERRSQSRASTVQPSRNQKPCTLLHYAELTKGGKSKRQVVAFGVAIPPAVTGEKKTSKDEGEYMLPYWVFPPPVI